MACARGKQTDRTDRNAKEPEEYYKLSVFIAFLDYLTSRLRSRFDEKLRKNMTARSILTATEFLPNTKKLPKTHVSCPRTTTIVLKELMSRKG